MGLGLHGGGVESARFFARHGAELVITDLRSPEVLKPSVEKLKEFPVKFVLGRHEEEDFRTADLIIKNPAVPDQSPFLAIAREKQIPIETDLSVFLSLTHNPVIAITGSKGKSSTSSAVHFCLNKGGIKGEIGGNITVNPLSFAETLTPGIPIVLELSSWQLADLKGKGVLTPAISMITNILPDHMNAYDSMDDYIKDKKLIFAGQSGSSKALFNYDDPVLKKAANEAQCEKWFFSASKLPEELPGAWLEGGKALFRDGAGSVSVLFEGPLGIPGEHNRMNLLAAALILKLYGMADGTIAETIPAFKGIGHRLELFYDKNGFRAYNDSAATIPQATVAAVKSLEPPVYLITGGTDKNIDFTPLREVFGLCAGIYLLEGTGTDKILPILNEKEYTFRGPYDNLEVAVKKAIEDSGARGSLVLSPGCASFGMFLNEFDRGRQFKETLLRLMGEAETE